MNVRWLIISVNIIVLIQLDRINVSVHLALRLNEVDNVKILMNVNLEYTTVKLMRFVSIFMAVFVVRKSNVQKVMTRWQRSTANRLLVFLRIDLSSLLVVVNWVHNGVPNIKTNLIYVVRSVNQWNMFTRSSHFPVGNKLFSRIVLINLFSWYTPTDGNLSYSEQSIKCQSTCGI